MVALFEPITLRGVTFANRIAVAPMCQYSARDGCPGDWHLIHLGQFAIGGAGLAIVEATGVEPEGRITPGCTGLYDDATETAFARVLGVCRAIGPARWGIQIGHAGRKAATKAPWLGGGPLPEAEAWVAEAPSAVPYLDGWTTPRALDDGGLARIEAAFGAAAARAGRLGFDYLELHAAHGYLLHSFLSPLTNRRGDGWGGDRAGRMRFPLACFRAARAAFPAERPMAVRVSARDWIEGGWEVEDTIAFAEALKAEGCDLIHVSSGGLSQAQEIAAGPGYQTGFAAAIRAATGMPAMAVGQITEPIQAETILRTGQAEMVALARAMLWNPRWAWHAAGALGAEAVPPAPYARAHPSLAATPFVTR